MMGTLAAVSDAARVAKGAEMRGFGEVAEWSMAAVLKTAAENIAHPQKSAKPAQILAETAALPIRSRGTSGHISWHRS